MVIFIVIIALCAVVQAQVEDKWIKVESPLDIAKYREILSKKIPSSTNKNMRRIIGGQAATWDQFPYHALLALDDGSIYLSLCGGSIVSHMWILTAAHWFVI